MDRAGLLGIGSKDGHLKGPLAMTTKEHTMYAHRVSVHLKPNSTAAFTQRLEQQVIPMLRKQIGADAYSLGPYVEVTKILANLVDGDPQVDTYEVSNSTFHKIGATATGKGQ
jgi:hypothetical protein